MTHRPNVSCSLVRELPLPVLIMMLTVLLLPLDSVHSSVSPESSAPSADGVQASPPPFRSLHSSVSLADVPLSSSSSKSLPSTSSSSPSALSSPSNAAIVAVTPIPSKPAPGTAYNPPPPSVFPVKPQPVRGQIELKETLRPDGESTALSLRFFQNGLSDKHLHLAKHPRGLLQHSPVRHALSENLKATHTPTPTHSMTDYFVVCQTYTGCSGGYTLVHDAATHACAGPVCTFSECCVAVRTCLDYTGGCSGSRVLVPNPGARKCQSFACTPAECCVSVAHCDGYLGCPDGIMLKIDVICSTYYCTRDECCTTTCPQPSWNSRWGSLNCTSPGHAVGSVCRPTCKAGYINNPSTIQCLNTGVWSNFTGCDDPLCIDQWPSAGETTIDCGGPCGPCPVGGVVVTVPDDSFSDLVVSLVNNSSQTPLFPGSLPANFNVCTLVDNHLLNLVRDSIQVRSAALALAVDVAKNPLNETVHRHNGTTHIRFAKFGEGVAKAVVLMSNPLKRTLLLPENETFDTDALRIHRYTAKNQTANHPFATFHLCTTVAAPALLDEFHVFHVEGNTDENLTMIDVNGIPGCSVTPCTTCPAYEGCSQWFTIVSPTGTTFVGKFITPIGNGQDVNGTGAGAQPLSLGIILAIVFGALGFLLLLFIAVRLYKHFNKPPPILPLRKQRREQDELQRQRAQELAMARSPHIQPFPSHSSNLDQHPVPPIAANTTTSTTSTYTNNVPSHPNFASLSPQHHAIPIAQAAAPRTTSLPLKDDSSASASTDARRTSGSCNHSFSSSVMSGDVGAAAASSGYGKGFRRPSELSAPSNGPNDSPAWDIHHYSTSRLPPRPGTNGSHFEPSSSPLALEAHASESCPTVHVAGQAASSNALARCVVEVVNTSNHPSPPPYPHRHHSPSADTIVYARRPDRDSSSAASAVGLLGSQPTFSQQLSTHRLSPSSDQEVDPVPEQRDPEVKSETETESPEMQPHPGEMQEEGSHIAGPQAGEPVDVGQCLSLYVT